MAPPAYYLVPLCKKMIKWKEILFQRGCVTYFTVLGQYYYAEMTNKLEQCWTKSRFLKTPFYGPNISIYIFIETTGSHESVPEELSSITKQASPAFTEECY